MKTRILLTSVYLVAALGCQSSEFARSPDKRQSQNAEPTPKPKPTEEPVSYALGCDLKDPLAVDLKGADNTLIKVKGEFCPRAFGSLSLLLVVDFSGSMRLTDPSNGITCGRLQAAEKIIQKVKADMRTGDNVKVGLVRFQNTASISTALMPIDQFEASSLTYAKLCGQDNAATNYQAAFETAERALTNADGTKSVFLISDGLPTVPGDGSVTTEASKQAGLSAAQGLLRDVQNATLNAVFLNADNSTDAAAYLEQLTGDKNRVKIASSASELADKIVELAIPMASITESTVAAQLSADGTQRNIKIAKIEKDPTHANMWVFESEPFTVVANEENLVTITAKDAANGEYKSILKVNAAAP